MVKKSPSNNTSLLIPIIIIFAIGVFWMNRQMHIVAPTDQELEQKSQQAEAAHAKTVVSAPEKPTMGQYGLAPETRVNDLSVAEVRILVGWQYDSANQANPKLVADCADAIKTIATKTGGIVGVVITDVDIPRRDRSYESNNFNKLGIYLNGTSPLTYTEPSGKVITFDANLGEGVYTPELITKALEQLHQQNK